LGGRAPGLFPGCKTRSRRPSRHYHCRSFAHRLQPPLWEVRVVRLEPIRLHVVPRRQLEETSSPRTNFWRAVLSADQKQVDLDESEQEHRLVGALGSNLREELIRYLRQDDEETDPSIRLVEYAQHVLRTGATEGELTLRADTSSVLGALEGRLRQKSEIDMAL